MHLWIYIICLFNIANANTNRFEELYIWKMSEALKLDAQQEEEFSNLIRTLNREKASAMASVDSSLSKLKEARSENEAEKLVTNYKKALEAYHKVSKEEVKKIVELFNYKVAADYLSIKNEVVKKLQKRLIRPTNVGDDQLRGRKPKVISEE